MADDSSDQIHQLELRLAAVEYKLETLDRDVVTLGEQQARWSNGQSQQAIEMARLVERVDQATEVLHEIRKDLRDSGSKDKRLQAAMLTGATGAVVGLYELIKYVVSVARS